MKFILTSESSAVHVDNISELYVEELAKGEQYCVVAVLRNNHRFPTSDTTIVYSKKLRTHEEAYNFLRFLVAKINAEAET